MPKKVEISHKTIVFTAFFFIGLWFLYFIRDILIQIFVAFLLMAILGPIVNFLSTLRVPRGISVFVSYFFFFGILGGAIALIIPALVDQTSSFVSSLPVYLNNIGVNQNLSNDLTTEFLTKLGSLPGEVIKFTFSLFSNLLSVVTVLVFAFYMLLSRGKLEDSLSFFFGEARKSNIGRVIKNLESKLGGWAIGQLTLMLLIGISTFIGLTIIGIPFALPLSILAAILEIIPYLGPLLAAVPSIIIGFGISPTIGLMVAGLTVLIQQLENYVFVPKVMEKSVGVSPIITLVALAIGARLAGIVGMIISIPTVITLQVFLKEYFFKED